MAFKGFWSIASLMEHGPNWIINECSDLLHMIVRDSNGDTLEFGDYVIYPHLDGGRSAHCRYAKVVGKLSRMKNKGTDKIAVVAAESSFDPSGNHAAPKLIGAWKDNPKPRRITINNPQRVIKVKPDSVPTDIREALEPAEPFTPSVRK
jgi:hypothetical protein